MEVGQKDRCPPSIGGSASSLSDTQEEIRQDDRDNDDQRCGRDDSTTPSAVEREKRCSSRRSPFTEQQTRDDEPRDGEEDVNTDIAARERRDIGVVKNDQEHSDRPQALDIGSEWTVFWSRAGFVA